MNLRNVFDVDEPTKNIKADAVDAPRFLSRTANHEQRTRHYIEHRWHDQYTYYTERAKLNRQRHLRLQLFIAVVAVLVPVLLGFNGEVINRATGMAQTEAWYSFAINTGNIRLWISFFNAVPAILSGLVAAATALENVQKFGDNWRAFQSAADGLERERALFEANSGPYRQNKNSYRLFIERSEDVIAQETGRYFARRDAQGEDDPDEDNPEDVYEQLMANMNEEGVVGDDEPIYDDVDVRADTSMSAVG
jgi:hypothetical protein